MKKIIGLGIAVAVIIALVTTGTLAQFSDTETSEDNVFTAGIIDLEIDAEDTEGVIFSAQDDPLPKIFNYLPESDIKPGDSGEVTISLHLKADSNNADLWMQVQSLENFGGLNPEPECEAEGGTWDNETQTCSGATSVDNDIASKILVKLWIDDNDASGTPGDNIWQDGETVLYDDTLSGLTAAGVAGKLTVKTDAVACITYYVGWSWELPSTVTNEHQGDYCTFDIVFGADQVTP